VPVLPLRPSSFTTPVAVLAAKLCVVVDQGDGNRLHLPERLVASAFFTPTPFHFAFGRSFAFDCHYCPGSPDRHAIELYCGMPTRPAHFWSGLAAGAIPSSSEVISKPSIQYFNGFGAVPINVAPLTGRVTMPSSNQVGFAGGEDKFAVGESTDPRRS